MTGLLALALGPTGRALGLALLAMGLLGAIYNAGASKARKACEAAALRAQIEALRGDLRAAQEAEARALQEMGVVDERAKINAQRVAELERLGGGKGACVLDADGARRLRAIQ